MVAPTNRQHGSSGTGSNDLLMWILGIPLLFLIVLMAIAGLSSDDAPVPTVAEATPQQIANGQSALAAVGCYSGEIDGNYGPLTDQAILDFQAASGIATDGIFGPDTLDALQLAVSAGAPVCTSTGGGDTGDGDSGGDTGGGDTGSGDTGGGDTGGADGGEEPGDTRLATLTSASVGPVTFTVTSWDCTGGDDDLTLVGSSDGGASIAVTMSGGSGTLGVDGGSEQDAVTLNGAMGTLSKQVGAFSATGTFVDPNFVGETYDLTGTC